MVISSSKPLASGVDDDALERFQIELERIPFIAAPVASFDRSRRVLGATMAVDTSNPDNVWQAGFAAFLGAAHRAGLKDAEWAEVRSWEGEERDYTRDELVGLAEIGRRLRISRERARQLSAGLFPQPVGRVATYAVWRWGDISDWAAVRNRKAGRPRGRAEIPSADKQALRKRGVREKSSPPRGRSRSIGSRANASRPER
jgi:hypothetical protein